MRSLLNNLKFIGYVYANVRIWCTVILVLVSMCFHQQGLLSTVKIFVLDEADYILGNKFVEDIEEINHILPPINKRQTVLFCASIPGKFEKAVYGSKSIIHKFIKSDFKEVFKEFLKKEYIFVCVGRIGGTLNFIAQSFFKVEPDTTKLKILTDILKDESKDNKKTIVFLETKEDAAAMAMFLCSCGFQVTVFHKDRCQKDREYALHQFNTGVKTIMICTSVSARGLDIVEVKTVINYDLSSDISTYLYRIGRTGRAGHAGKAISFFVKGRDEGIARGLVKNLSMLYIFSLIRMFLSGLMILQKLRMEQIVDLEEESMPQKTQDIMCLPKFFTLYKYRMVVKFSDYLNFVFLF
nr:ATP-dependent RNA helicase DED1-like isoform X5 [Hydra vulgaris]